MDLIYDVRKQNHPKLQFDALNIEKHFVKISHNHVIAWISRYDLKDPTNRMIGSHIYVADMNMPWNFYEVTFHRGQIKTLEWDLYGENLLICDDSGMIGIWGYKDHNFNEWVCVASKQYVGEYFIAGGFFHMGRKICLLRENKDSSMYSEKFINMRFVPTLRARGFTGVEGCIAISSSGLIVAMAINDLGKLVNCTESVSIARYKIMVADICYGKNGHLIVATSMGGLNMPVKCYEVSIKYNERKNLQVTSTPMASFFVDKSKFNSSKPCAITCLRFVFREAASSLIVVANGKCIGVIQMWELTESGDSEAENLSTLWVQRANFQMDSVVISVSTPKISMFDIPGPYHIIVTLKNNKIMAFSQSLKQEMSFDMDSYWESGDLKKYFGNLCLVAIDVTHLGQVFAILDTIGNFYVFRIPPADSGAFPSIFYAVTLLEFALVSSLDWWDVVITTKNCALEGICEKLAENFEKQPPQTQQTEYSRFLNMKTFLLRGAANSDAKYADQLYLFNMNAIWTSFRGILRPSELSSFEKGPCETLSSVLTNESITDIDAVLVSIEPKEFTVNRTDLISMQQLIQWIANLALNILGRVPTFKKSIGSSYDIVADARALNILRETLVIVRIWGLLRPQCLPVFLKNVENFDGLSTLFRLTTRLLQCVAQGNDPDDGLIDECCLLQNQVLIPALMPAPERVCDLSSPALHKQPWPISLTFGTEPDRLQYITNLAYLDVTMYNTRGSDVIRQMYIGTDPKFSKRCNKCHGITIPAVLNAPKTYAVKSWENRWTRACICGGRWSVCNRGSDPYKSTLLARHLRANYGC